MANDPLRAAQMGKAARAEAEQRFSLPAMVAAYRGLYQRQLAATGRQRTTGRLDNNMCGITGIFDTRGARPIARPVLHRMNESQLHRGPDEGSLHIEPGVGLGHRRLSIIDIATGQQPLFNEDHSVVVVFNGEIYNYQELIPELQALGHVFRTKSDTEVIVHAWEAWGEDCVKRFRGMFAFALWDRNRQTLFLARDRLGVKPLYYALLDDGTLLFGSELKSLLAHGGLRRDIDPLAVEEYFALGYVAEPRTIFRQARKLPPAHTLLHPPRPARAASRKEYWDVHFTLDNPMQRARRLRRAACSRLRRIGQAAHDLRGAAGRLPVRRRRFQRRGRRRWPACPTDPVNTCSIAFDDPAFNESDIRADGGRPLPHQPPRRDRAQRRLRSHRHAGAAVRRALRRQLGHSHLPRLPTGAQARHGGAVG